MSSHYSNKVSLMSILYLNEVSLISSDTTEEIDKFMALSFLWRHITEDWKNKQNAESEHKTLEYSLFHVFIY